MVWPGKSLSLPGQSYGFVNKVPSTPAAYAARACAPLWSFAFTSCLHLRLSPTVLPQNLFSHNRNQVIPIRNTLYYPRALLLNWILYR